MAETRSERIAVKITPSLFRELETLASEIGQTPSTLAAVYLGEMVNKKRIERQNNQRMADSVGKAFKEMFEPMTQAIDSVIAGKLPEER